MLNMKSPRRAAANEHPMLIHYTPTANGTQIKHILHLHTDSKRERIKDTNLLTAHDNIPPGFVDWQNWSNSPVTLIKLKISTFHSPIQIYATLKRDAIHEVIMRYVVSVQYLGNISISHFESNVSGPEHAQWMEEESLSRAFLY